jgi:hypothetical protein
MMSGDGALYIFAVIMIEKSFFEGEDLTTIEFVFNGEILIPGY